MRSFTIWDVCSQHFEWGSRLWSCDIRYNSWSCWAGAWSLSGEEANAVQVRYTKRSFDESMIDNAANWNCSDINVRHAAHTVRFAAACLRLLHILVHRPLFWMRISYLLYWMISLHGTTKINFHSELATWFEGCHFWQKHLWPGSKLLSCKNCAWSEDLDCYFNSRSNHKTIATLLYYLMWSLDYILIQPAWSQITNSSISNMWLPTASNARH